MGLENLKSIFSDINTDVNTRENGTAFESELLPGQVISRFNFNNPIPSTDFFQDPPEGFTINFDDKGTGLGNSKFIDVNTKFDDDKTIEFETRSRTFSVDRPLKLIGEDDSGLFQLQSQESFESQFALQELAGGQDPQIFDKDKILFRYISEQGNNKEINIKESRDGVSEQFNLLYDGNEQNAKKLKRDLSGIDTNTLRLERELFGFNEPFITSPIGEIDSGREFPIARSTKDLERLGKYLLSPDGLAFFAKQNLLGANSIVNFSEPSRGSFLGMSKRDLFSSKQRFKSAYLQTSTLAASTRLYGYATPNGLFSRDFPASLIDSLLPAQINQFFGSAENYEKLVPDTIESSFRPVEGASPFSFKSLGEKLTKAAENKLRAAAGLPTKIERPSSDVMTTAPINVGSTLKDAITSHLADNDTDLKNVTKVTDAVKNVAAGNIGLSKVESEEHGMPFYFKDLRHDEGGAYIVFRAYLESITEDISPSWATENYIGRSEPVYNYERAERSANFTLTLAAGTQDELTMIYEKLDKLTSLCYPRYKQDKNLNGLNRMKAPLVHFRMGEMFGNDSKDQLCFIKSLSYSVPESSTWETDRGFRVPRLIKASIGLQILHEKLPSFKTPKNNDLSFHGFAGMKQYEQRLDSPASVAANALNL